jgi:hypothetical protein
MHDKWRVVLLIEHTSNSMLLGMYWNSTNRGGYMPLILIALSVAFAPLTSFASDNHAAIVSSENALSERKVALLIPARVRDRDGWSRDIVRTFSGQNLPTSAGNVCAVLAVIEQESGFDPKPKSRNLRKAIERKIEEVAGVAGPLVARTALDAKQDNVRKVTYWQRIEKADREYDADRAIRDYLADIGIGSLFDNYEFFTTVGSMQVSVSYAREQATLQGMGEQKMREFLYTRYGGIYFGTLRLLGYPAAYRNMAYRFADYNVGMYASRNAAIQQQVARLTGRHLALDGDLLRYGKNSIALNGASDSERAIVEAAERYALNLDSRVIREDLLLEKTIAFENTETYQSIKRIYQARYGHAPYARLPVVEIKGPKITSKFFTAGYARRVSKRYMACLDQA